MLRSDRRTDGRTDGQAKGIPIIHSQLCGGGLMTIDLEL